MVEGKMKRQSGSRTSTCTVEDWEENALDAIAAGGLRSLSIPELARTLGVTKGSFYWHFASLDELIAASLRRWEAGDDAIILQLEAIREPQARLRAAFTEAQQSPRAHALYSALSASGDARVTAVLRRISERRFRFLVAAYGELGFESDEAENRALLAYLAYIGLTHIRRTAFPRRLTASRMDGFVAHAVDTLIPAPSPPVSGRK
jgi:AcrR family transcriptional regulator